MARLTEPNTPLKREDLSDEMVVVDHKTCPFTSSLKKEGPPNDSIFFYPVDSYDAPKTTGRPDGKDVQSAEEAHGMENATKLGACIQWHHRAVSVGKIANTVPDIAGVGKGKVFARGVGKKMVELKRDMEYTYLSSKESRVDDGTNGYETRGVGSWISTGAQAHLPVPTAYRPKAAQVVTVASIDVLTEGNVNDMLEAMFQVTGSKSTINGYVTTALKKAFSNFRNIQANVAGFTHLRRYGNDLDDRKISNVVDIYEGDFGTIQLIPVLYIDPTPVTGNAPKQLGYFLHQERWHTRNQQAPGAEDLPNNGGGPRKQIDAIAALACDNPQAEGKIQLS